MKSTNKPPPSDRIMNRHEMETMFSEGFNGLVQGPDRRELRNKWIKWRHKHYDWYNTKSYERLRQKKNHQQWLLLKANKEPISLSLK